MIKYYCDRCWDELKDKDVYSTIKFEHFEFLEKGSVPANDFLDIKQMLCEKCTKDIKNYILRTPLKYDAFLGKYIKGERTDGQS